MLGLVLALGMSASAVQATDMTVKMALASDMGAQDHDPCAGCTGDGSGMKVTGCDIVCVAPAVAALPQTVSFMHVDARELPLPAQPLLVGWALPPDPHPPRSS